jgi:hypothetical protein
MKMGDHRKMLELIYLLMIIIVCLMITPISMMLLMGQESFIMGVAGAMIGLIIGSYMMIVLTPNIIFD